MSEPVLPCGAILPGCGSGGCSFIIPQKYARACDHAPESLDKPLAV